ncbi:MAG: putative quinol monooxygenase [Comamonas sp.]|uniref:putative quinol monooxygenase n=1 Tax=Comamonas sp. TaxID=34028 RepID=UPI003D0CD96B
MLLIVGTVRLPAANLERALPAMRAMVEASRAEAGCLEYGYAQDVLEPGLIHVKELWSDQAALDAFCVQPYPGLARCMACAGDRRPRSARL